MKEEIVKIIIGVGGSYSDTIGAKIQNILEVI